MNKILRARTPIVQAAMDRFAALTDRTYKLFEYDGAADAERFLKMLPSPMGIIFDPSESLKSSAAGN